MNKRLSIFFFALVICFCGQIKPVTSEQVKTEVIKNGLEDSFFIAPVFYRLLCIRPEEIDETLLPKIVKFSTKIHLFFLKAGLEASLEVQKKLEVFFYSLPLVDRGFIVCLLRNASDEKCRIYGGCIANILKAAAEKLGFDVDCLYKVGSNSEKFILNPEGAKKFLSESFSALLSDFFECVQEDGKLIELSKIVGSQWRKYPTMSDGNILFISWLLCQTSKAIERISEKRKVVS